MKKRMIALVCAVAMLVCMLGGCGEKETTEIKTPEIATITPGDIITSAPSEQPNQTPAAPAPETDSGYYTVYAKGVSPAYLWAWSADGANLYEAWPGEPMTLGADGWYSMRIPVAYDYVVVSNCTPELNASGANWMQTQDEYTYAEDFCVVFSSDGTYDGYNGTPSGSADTTGAASTSTADKYEQLFAQMGIDSTPFVSQNYEVMAIATNENDFVMRIEYAYDGNGVQELALVYYYPLAYFNLQGISAADLATFEQQMDATLEAMFANTSCAVGICAIEGSYVVLALYAWGLSDLANVRAFDAAVQAGMGVEGLAGVTDFNGRIVMPEVSEAEASGAYVKIW